MLLKFPSLSLSLFLIVPLALTVKSEVYKTDKSLKQLILIWRHGDRSPVRGYPNYEKDYGDTFENIWPKGPGQLSVHGSKNHKELGTFLKKRYKNFIPDEYNMRDVYIRSTDVDKTLMSAVANTMGMYNSPDTTDTAVDDITGNFSIFENFLPIPVHTVDKSRDYLLRIPNRKDICPVYETLEKIVHDSEGFKKINEKYKDLFRLIEENSGLKGEQSSMDVFKLWEIADPIQVSTFHGHKLPTWLSPEKYNEINDLWGYGAFSIFSDLEKSVHSQMSRLNGGLLIKTIQEDMERILDENLKDDSDGADVNSPHKIRIYSAHDTTLTGLMVALDNYNFLQPPYASCLIFELYDDKSLKLLFRNDTANEPVELQLCKDTVLGDLGNDCLLKDWVKETSYLVVEDEEEFFKECGKTTLAVTNSRILYLFTLLITTWLGIVVNLVFKLVNKKSSRDINREQNNSNNKNNNNSGGTRSNNYRNLDSDHSEEDLAVNENNRRNNRTRNLDNQDESEDHAPLIER